MVFVTAGMGGGTGTGAAPVVAGIAKELGVSEDETITIGDSTNDISLLKFGYGMAVASGTEELKKVAKYIAPPIEELPVKCVIEKILKGEDFN